METSEALLKRKGLIDQGQMESRWAGIDCIYQGQSIKDSSKTHHQEKQRLSAFSWLMVTLVTALDICMTSSGIKALLMEAFARILTGNKDTEDSLRDSLRVQLPLNIETWRSVGCVRGMFTVISNAMKRCREDVMQERAVPQLNRAEQEEMKDFVIWLMEGKSNTFRALSAMTFAVADSIRQAKVKLRTKGERTYETEPLVLYVQEGGVDQTSGIPWIRHYSEYDDPFKLKRGIESKAQQIAYACNEPMTMIDTVPTSRKVTNRMEVCWKAGSDAAKKLKLYGEAQLPFPAESEIYYLLDLSDPIRSKFGPELSMLATHAFPASSQGILLALEELTKGVSSHRLEWLDMHTSLEYLLHRETSFPSRRAENMELWLQYQALVFGFYYKLLEPLVSLEFLRSDAYFYGIWGYGSTTFLAMCTQFGDMLRRHSKVSRTHLLYMLSAMYGGRPKIFSNSSGMGLLGTLGNISVFAMPLLRVSDLPSEISKFALVDLPVVDLMSETNGEIYAGNGCGIDFDHACAEPVAIRPHGPGTAWSVHAKMGILFGEGQTGVVMAARCGGRLVGWFNPLAADVMFLSTAYVAKRHDEEPGYVDQAVVSGFEVRDEDWKRGHVQRPIDENPLNRVGVIHSRGCPALRYAAAGFYASAGEEVAIATDDIEAAVGRVESPDGQDGGIAIA